MIFFVRPLLKYYLATNELHLLYPKAGLLLAPKIEVKACKGATILLYEENDPLAEPTGMLNLIPGDYDLEDVQAACARKLNHRSTEVNVRVRMPPKPDNMPD